MSRAFSVEEIQQLMESMAKHRLGEFSYECEGTKLKLKSGLVQVAVPTPAEGGIPVMSAPAAAVQPAVAESPAPSPVAGIYVTSPIVGTFYAAPSPDKDPFVTVGQKINKGDIAFIIESMKVMNEVPSDFGGTVAEILVENGQPVEFGQNILRLE